MMLYKALLLDNVRDEECFGDTESLRAKHWQIVGKLNAMALQLTAMSFIDLCAIAQPHSLTPPTNADRPRVDLRAGPGGE
jgi:hypothetical protein